MRREREKAERVKDRRRRRVRLAIKSGISSVRPTEQTDDGPNKPE